MGEEALLGLRSIAKLGADRGYGTRINLLHPCLGPVHPQRGENQKPRKERSPSSRSKSSDAVEKVGADFSGLTRRCCARERQGGNAANDGSAATHGVTLLLLPVGRSDPR